MIALPKKRRYGTKVPIIDGKYKQYPDGRQVCLNTPKGRQEYRMRTYDMADRQKWLCLAPGCPQARTLMHVQAVTFQHGMGRGMNGKHRDDRIDQPGNEAWHYFCNAERGSQRTV